MTEVFPNLMNIVKLTIHKAERTPSRRDIKKTTPHTSDCWTHQQWSYPPELCLFPWANFLGVHPHCHKGQDFPLLCWRASAMWLHHIVFIHSSAGWPLSWLPVSPVVSSEAMNLGIVSLYAISFPSSIDPAVGKLDHMTVLVFIFKEVLGYFHE